MPELPEVETIKAYLEPKLSGSVLTHLFSKRTDIWQSWPGGMDPDILLNKKLLSMDRVGKYLLFSFESSLTLIVHLRMTGKLIYLPVLSEEEQTKLIEEKHCHVVFYFEDKGLAFHDVRRFGKLTLVETEHLSSLPGGFNSLGPDAVSDEFTWNSLKTFADHHGSMPIKSMLLDQRCVAGIGNIYADESLFRSKILPTRKASKIKQKEWKALHHNIVEVLEEAIEAGGTSFRDYRNATNTQGYFKIKLKVYGRSGQPCTHCGSPLSSEVISGRRSVYCKSCQK